MNIKKLSASFMALAMSAAFFGCSNKPAETEKTENAPAPAPASTQEQKADEKDKGNEGSKKIAVLLYQADDTYIATVRQALEKIDAEDDSIEFKFQDAGNNQGSQTDQINNVIAQGVDGILLNIVDVKAAPTVMGAIKAANIPTVFFNRDMTESLKEDNLNDFIFVGTNASEAGVMQGELLAALREKGNMDRNGNGKLDYVMLNGGVDNPEAQARTEYSVKTLTDKGIDVNELALQDCARETEKAKTAMDSRLQTYQNDIDAVIANNDGMAIGAISSLQGIGFNTGSDDQSKYIPVVGVDATEQAKEAIKANTMFGTVLQDADGMAKTCADLIRNKINGKDRLDGTDYKLAEDKVSIRVPYQKYEK